MTTKAFPTPAPEPDALALAEQLANDVLAPYALLEYLDNTAAVEAALVRDMPAHIRKDWLDADAVLEVIARIEAALPPELHRDVFALQEAMALTAHVRREAGFLAGVAIGRRIGGAQ